MLEQREHLVGGLQGDHHRFDDPGLAPQRAEVLVDVALAGALMEDLHALVGPHDHHVVLLVQATEEGRDGHPGRVGQPGQRREAGGRLPVFDLGHHAQGDLSHLGELGHGQVEGPPGITHPLAHHPTDVVR